ncbi:hypothetical protein RRG08_048044 [Elysia crispata]|uniref:Uncharacterized protein n=1 Tax=Elysia crispata TaxID=231223 RepID=A0AAE0Z303_9GAST|nr:hypothetical protein RRG08_048044 [Elysia crispata]
MVPDHPVTPTKAGINDLMLPNFSSLPATLHTSTASGSRLEQPEFWQAKQHVGVFILLYRDQNSKENNPTRNRRRSMI